MGGRGEGARGKRVPLPPALSDCLHSSPPPASNEMKKRASEGGNASCLVVVTRRAILPFSKEREERECHPPSLPYDAAAAEQEEAALFMTLFGLGGLEGPEAKGGRQTDRQAGGKADGEADSRADRQTDRRSSFSGIFCTSAFLPSFLLYKSTTFPSLEKSAANHTKKRESARKAGGRRRKAESHK